MHAFVREVSERHDKTFPGISPEAMQILRQYAWPGNIRELRNLVESMVVLAPGRVIRPEDIPDEVRRGRGASLLPVPIVREAGGGGTKQGSTLRPELEFVFRTLVELRVDMDELRRDFEAYRREATVPLAGETVLGRFGAPALGTGPVDVASYAREELQPEPDDGLSDARGRTTELAMSSCSGRG